MRKVVYRTPSDLKKETEIKKADFQVMVKKLSVKKPGNLDDAVHSLHQKAFESFSCLDCANCCKTIGPRLIDKDIEALAKRLKMKTSVFIEKHTMVDEDGDFIFREHPCPFLLPDNYCSVYEDRPRACREYPHTDRKRFYQILSLSLKNCETCPVVFEIFTELKKVKW